MRSGDRRRPPAPVARCPVSSLPGPHDDIRAREEKSASAVMMSSRTNPEGSPAALQQINPSAGGENGDELNPEIIWNDRVEMIPRGPNDRRPGG